MDPLHDPRNVAQITPTTGNIAPSDALERPPLQPTCLTQPNPSRQQPYGNTCPQAFEITPSRMAHSAHVHSTLTKQRRRLSLPKSHALNSIRDRTTSKQRCRTDTTIRKTAQSLANKHTQKECRKNPTIIHNTAAVSPDSRHPLFQAALLGTQQDTWLTPDTSTRQEQGCNTAPHRSATRISWFFRTLHGDSFVFPKHDTHYASTKVEQHSKPARISWVPPGQHHAQLRNITDASRMTHHRYPRPVPYLSTHPGSSAHPRPRHPFPIPTYLKDAVFTCRSRCPRTTLRRSFQAASMRINNHD